MDRKETTGLNPMLSLRQQIEEKSEGLCNIGPDQEESVFPILLIGSLYAPYVRAEAGTGWCGFSGISGRILCENRRV